MKKVLVALLIISCALISCSKQIPNEPVKEQKNRIYIQVEAVYHNNNLDLSPTVSISL